MNPISIIVHMKARPEHNEVVQKRLLALVALTTKEAGNVFYRLHEAIADPCHFIIYERWENQEALDFHMQQDYLLQFLNDSSRLLAEEIRGTLCHEIPVTQAQEGEP